mgnify:FL=1|jgi:transposase
MGKSHFTDEFKISAVEQVTERGHSVAEVAERLGVSAHSIYGWKKQFSSSGVKGSSDQAAEVQRLKRELARVTEERDILKKATAYFAKDAG